VVNHFGRLWVAFVVDMKLYDMESNMNSPRKTETIWEDAKISTRIKLSALWVVVMLCYIEGDFTSFFPPGGHIQVQ
jgi:hypothetical protein